MPPDQNASQTRSTLLFNSPVITALLNSPYKPEQDCIYEATDNRGAWARGARLPGMSVACAMIPALRPLTPVRIEWLEATTFG